MPKNEQLVFEESTHVYRLMPSGTRLPSVSEIIDPVFPFKSFCADIVIERAANFGTAIHKVIELDIKNTLDYSTVDISLMPYINQWQKVCDKLHIFKTQCKTEVISYSKKYKFAGRIDVISDKCIIDIKTGQKDTKHRLQISAYRHLVNCNQKEKIKEGLVIYLDGTSSDAKIEKEKPEDFGCFLSILNLYNWKKLNKI